MKIKINKNKQDIRGLDVDKLFLLDYLVRVFLQHDHKVLYPKKEQPRRNICSCP